MFRDSVRFPSIYFIISTIWQFIVNKEVSLIDNIGIFVMMFLMFLFWNWAKVPYEWKKDKTE